jgi:serine carboxypeptidase-like clade 1
MRLLVCVALLFAAVTRASPLNDLVQHLPLYGTPPSPQFSGYLDATDGCDTETNGPYCKIHYWFALAENDFINKPVVLWLNGGPGSSSVLGFLQENGPLLINSTGGLHYNPYTWTKRINLLVIESPIGVGYSYCQKQTLGKLCKNTDKYTASGSRAALQTFFTVKFPELATNDFFITGESYAGVYIPTLSKEILDHAPEINLKGIAVGDPCTDNKAQNHSMDSLWYGYKYGLIDAAVFDQLWNKCQARLPNLMTMGGKHLVAAKWNQRLKEQHNSTATTGRHLSHYATAMLKNYVNGGPRFRNTPECLLAFRKFIISSSSGLSQGWKDLYVDDYSLFAPIDKQQDLDMNAYMNRADVRKALHVEETPIAEWPFPDAGFDYTKEYDACNWDEVPEGALSMIDFYKDIVPRLKTTIVYNGDTDPCVSYEGTRTAMKRVGFDELDGGSYRPWFYNQTGSPLSLLAEKAPLFGPGLLVKNMGAQFGGEVVNYENGLSFVTVHGSGHMVPQFRPQAALHMVNCLVNYKEMSPLLPTNATLMKMDEDMFANMIDSWTETAMSRPYVTDMP